MSEFGVSTRACSSAEFPLLHAAQLWHELAAKDRSSQEAARDMKAAKLRRSGASDVPEGAPTAGPARLSRRSLTVKGWLEAQPGAEGRALILRKNSAPSALIFKVMGKMFAVLSLRGVEHVILKCDPTLAPVLREEYQGVGHRSHLDRRYWISVELKADVPLKEIKRLVSISYDLVCQTLTAKQRRALAECSAPEKGAANT